jgi:Fur family ferric uptake transcriptional regulator
MRTVDQDERWREGAYAAIRASGGRVTVATRALLDVLLESDQHLAADQLIATVQRRAPGISPSTIYRGLQRLDEVGVVEHVHSGAGPAFYHLRRRGHAHLVCHRCGRVVDIPDQLLASVGRTMQRRYGFTVDPHHAALLGQCGSCLKASAVRRGAHR